MGKSGHGAITTWKTEGLIFLSACGFSFFVKSDLQRK